MYSLTYRKPPSLVPRRLVFEITERLDYEGDVVNPFDGECAKHVADEIRASGVDSVAVCFLHAYANPSHELAMEKVLLAVMPELDVTLSHRLVREYREYERTSTTVIDAYVKPVVRRYLRDLDDALRAADFDGRFLVTRSAGGAMTVETAIAQPAHLVLSGPASGVIGAAAFGAMIDLPNLITIDMGGTSLDASLIVGGSPTTVNETRFHGHPLAIPSLNIHTIGAGGGSIAWLDPAGHLQVGPQSAAAVPGPACYGRGGTAATVTDAALAIGYLGEDTALGGELTLQRGLAEEAVATLANSLGIDPGKLADGILDLTTAKVAGAVREITVEQGHDPRDFALLAFGGGGGLLACDVARDLGIPRVVIPPGPGAFSAFGMLLTDVIHDITQTKIVELKRIDPPTLEDVFLSLEGRALAALQADGFTAEAIDLHRSADLRFEGQEHTVSVPMPSTKTSGFLEALAETFGTLHEARYGHRMTDPVEMATARVRAIGRVPRPTLPRVGSGEPHRARIGRRQVTMDGRSIEYEVLRREALGSGASFKGPVIVEERTATTVVGPADTLDVGEFGELVITVAPRQPGTAR